MQKNSFNCLLKTGLRSLFALVLITGLAACTSAPVKEEVIVAAPVVKEGKPVLSEQDKANYRRGIELISQQNYDEAKQIFSELLSANPKLTGAIVNLGLIEQGQGELDKAKAYYQQALAINTVHIQALVQLAGLKQAEGAFKETESLLLKAYSSQATNPLVNYNLGVLYELYLRQYDKAIKHYTIYVANSDNEDTKKVERWIKMLERK